MDNKYNALLEKLRSFKSAAIAFSGGVDSVFLARAAREALGERSIAIMANGVVVSSRERDDAKKYAREIGIELHTVEIDVFGVPEFVRNGRERCYFCKLQIMGALKAAVQSLGYGALMEASNTSDLSDYRPGMRAIEELGIISPLIEMGYSKVDIRSTSKMLGLSSWNKPSFACLASRIPYDRVITPELLCRIERAESELFSMGFRQLRVRDHEAIARIELPEEDIEAAIAMRSKISSRLKECGYDYVCLDLGGFVSGNMNCKMTDNNEK